MGILNFKKTKERPTTCPVCGLSLGIELDDENYDGEKIVVFSCPKGHRSILLNESRGEWDWI